MTPAEFKEKLDAVYKDREDRLKTADMMNAQQCLIIARCAGNDTLSREDLMTFNWNREKKPETKVPVMGDTPDQIAMKLKLLTASMGGADNGN